MTDTPCCEGRCSNVTEVTDEVLQQGQHDALVAAQASESMRRLALHEVQMIPAANKDERSMKELVLSVLRKLPVD